jgi:MFS family permease
MALSTGVHCDDNLRSILLRKSHQEQPQITFENSPLHLLATTDMFVFGFIIPILPYMLGDRLRVDPANLQALMSGLLAVHSAASFISLPIIGVLADRTPGRNVSLLKGLWGELASTVLVDIAPNRKCS